MADPDVHFGYESGEEYQASLKEAERLRELEAAAEADAAEADAAAAELWAEGATRYTEAGGQIDDGYGHPVYGNILDKYALPNYNLKLYMMRETTDPTGVSGPTHDPSLTTDKPEDMIIVAQTGVTTTTIDNLEIDTLIATETHNSTGMRFTITQPGAVTFLDQLHLSRIHLGQQNDTIPVLFLEVSFKGYSADIENEDDENAGKLEEIGEPYRWKIYITKIDIEVNAGGSVYNIEAKPINTIAFTPGFYTIPFKSSTSGGTISEHVKDLQEQLNDYHRDDVDNNKPDTYTFDLTSLIGTGADGTVGPLKIADETLISTKDVKTEDRNRQLNERLAQTEQVGDYIKDKELYDQSVTEDANPTVQELTFGEDILPVAKGKTMEQYFKVLLSMNDEFLNKISKLEDLGDPTTDAKDMAYTTWFKMEGTVKYKEYDYLRGTFAKEIIYKPILYKSSRDDIILKAREARRGGSSKSEQGPLAEKNREAHNKQLDEIIAGHGLMKAYHYLFSGLNDQIENLDIKYDAGIAYLVPAAGGAIGAGANVLSLLEGSIPVDRDTTVAGVVDIAEEAKVANAEASFNNLLDTIGDLIDSTSTAGDQFLQMLKNTTGLDDEVLKGAIEDKNSQEREKLDDALAKEKGAKEKILENTNANGSPTEAAGTVPELHALGSDILYSVDLVNPLETPLTAEEMDDLGYIKLDEAAIETAKEAILKPQIKTDSGDPAVDTQAATIERGSLKNNLFGAIASQRDNDAAFMITAEITLRGDPWYIGTDAKPVSGPNAVRWGRDDNHMMLTIRSPKTFDMDWRDEDSDINSGYWKSDGVSRAFSGLYRIVTCTNMFSGGVYTVEANLQRLMYTFESLKNNKVKAKEAKESAPVSDIPFYKDADEGDTDLRSLHVNGSRVDGPLGQNQIDGTYSYWHWEEDSDRWVTKRTWPAFGRG